ncbi:hypothetical protein B0H11DRAFT_2225109 [Mycena galericulata]|nr:hypothetical protein B0H11DRAFT_2225109 [Mycena galericulata]
MAVLPGMTWERVFRLVDVVKDAVYGWKRTQYAWLYPDGHLKRGGLWACVPVVRGHKYAYDVDHMETELWLDATRGHGGPTTDLDRTSHTVHRFPFDEPCDLPHSYTVVVMAQRSSGHGLDPINFNIVSMVPELELPWRGNVLVFKHGKGLRPRIISIQREDIALVDAIVKRVIRDGLCGV